MTDDEYFQFCQINRKVHTERTAQGDILITPPAGFESGFRNSERNAQLRNWALKDGRVGILIPTPNTYCPMVPHTHPMHPGFLAQALAKEQKRKFPMLCPDSS